MSRLMLLLVMWEYYIHTILHGCRWVLVLVVVSIVVVGVLLGFMTMGWFTITMINAMSTNSVAFTVIIGIMGIPKRVADSLLTLGMPQESTGEKRRDHRRQCEGVVR